MFLKKILQKIAILLLVFIPFSAFSSEKVLLKVNSTSASISEEYTLQQLQQLPQYEIKTSIPWSNSVHTFKGPSLEDVLALANAKGQWLTMSALDSYKISFDYQRIKKFQPILALQVDGKLLTVRTKGPIWVILPLDKYEALDAAVYHDFMVWQLVKLDVEEKGSGQ